MIQIKPRKAQSTKLVFAKQDQGSRRGPLMRSEALSTPSAGPLSPTGGECMTLFMVATNHRDDG